MLKKFKKKDCNLARLLFFLNLLLISPLLIRTEDDVENLNYFEKKLFYNLVITKPNHNLIVSPLSLAILLITIRATSTLGVSSEIDKTFALAGMSDSAISQRFEKILENFKHPDIISIKNTITIVSENNVVSSLVVDANANIHAWSVYDVCETSLKYAGPGKQTELVLTTETYFHNLVLKNSITSIDQGSFVNNYGEVMNVDVLRIVAKLKYADFPALHSQVIEIPFSDDDTSLVIVLPEKYYDVSHVGNNLDAYSLCDILSNAKEEVIELTLPKFIASVELELEEDLKNLGIRSMFEQLCASPLDIRVSKVIYKAAFLFDDKNPRDNPISDEELTVTERIQVDHPFIYIVKSSKNVIYVMGQYLTNLFYKVSG